MKYWNPTIAFKMSLRQRRTAKLRDLPIYLQGF